MRKSGEPRLDDDLLLFRRDIDRTTPWGEDLEVPDWVNVDYIDTNEDEVGRTYDYRMGRPRGEAVRLGSAVLAGAMVVSFLSAANRQVYYEIDKHAGLLVEAVGGAAQVRAFQKVPLSEIKSGPSLLEDELISLRADEASVVRLSQKNRHCTATLVNDILISAGHCVKAEESFRITRPDAESMDRPAGYLRSYVYDQERDLLIGKPSPVFGQEARWIGTFSNELPEAGASFIGLGLPGDSGYPRTGDFTYIGEHPEGGGMLVFVEEMADDSLVCRPGGSGTLISDHEDRVAIVSATVEDLRSIDNWEDYYNIQLSENQHFCLATHLTRQLLDSMVAMLPE